MSRSDGNAVLVNVLSSSVRSTLNGMETAPGLIRRVLEEGSWRQFTTPRGEEVTHDTFESFVTTAPTGGLGRTLDDVVRLIGDDEDTLDLLARALDIPIDSLREPGQRTAGIDLVQRDAHDFGAYARSGGWHFGLLVARNVQPGSGQGKKSGSSLGESNEVTKVSAKDFADMAGTKPSRVMRFYRAWERAAEAGVVPAFEDLAPGVDVELPDGETWSEYFTSAERSTDRRQKIAAEAEAAGTSFVGALHVAHHPSDLRTAILADAKTAEAAREALMQRLEEDPELQAAMARTVAEVPQLKKAVAAETRRTDQLDYVRKVAEHGNFKTPAGQIVEASVEVKAEAERQLAQIEHLADANPAESITEAYETVQQLISESIETDPAVNVRERQARFYSNVQKASKAFEQLNLNDLADMYEADMVEKLESLQRSVTACIESLRKAAPRPALRAVGGA